MLNPLIAPAGRRRQMLYPVFWMSDQLDRTFWLVSVAALPRSELMLQCSRGARLRGVSPRDRRPCGVVAPGRCRKSARALNDAPLRGSARLTEPRCKRRKVLAQARAGSLHSAGPHVVPGR